jgi:aspartyl-tRNA(Asn)/glutamyl-tRNA(Gln) amidotransferase subunit B
MDWEIVIGLETHAQLSTASKIFSGASTAFGAPANTQACAVDLALPGVLPVANRGAVERAIRFGLAVNGKRADHISRRSIFARKNYFYPDLPKGYQISQFELPIVTGGSVVIATRNGEKTVRLTRAHLEEDAGKSLHEDFHGMSGIDLNRAGTPLLEIVSEPDMRSAEEAVAYARALHALVRWIGICDGNMQEGSFRCDANVSVRRPGGPLGTRREIKNLNSFRFLQQAIEYEVAWQIETLEGGGKIQQATVLFDPDSGQTRVMRTKEDAHDYRYFPDPDLLPIAVGESWIEETRAGMGELPDERKARFERTMGLSAYDAGILTSTREIGDYFSGVIQGSLRGGETVEQADFKLCANWVINEVQAKRNADNLEPHQFGVSDSTLGYLLRLVRGGDINAKTAKDLFSEFWEASRASGFSALGGDPAKVDELIASRGLKQMSDTGELESILDQVLAANQKSVEEFRAGKEKAFNALVGQAMKATKGKGNPATINALLREKLGKS